MQKLTSLRSHWAPARTHRPKDRDSGVARVSVIVLTYNSERTIAATLASATVISDDVHVVDSLSTDRTVHIAAQFRANIVQHPFESYSKQRNWAMRTLTLHHPWELHLDSDERLSDALAGEIAALVEEDCGVLADGYLIPRLVHFMGRPIRHGGMFPLWHLRLFRRGKGHCEEREYDQHFIVNGRIGRLRSPMIDDIRMPLTEWTARHNRWSDAEVRELMRAAPARLIAPRFFGSPIERQRRWRSMYDRMPRLVRAFALFAYRYVLRGGFLDGREGAIFFVLQTFWFRFLVDAKLIEQEAALLDRSAPAATTLASTDPIDMRRAGS
jgi:glycosyltransferase involved in cell wall biosynthesis